VTYLKERKQFGKLIGEFQALQHRAAELYIDIEITRAAVLKALQTLDGDLTKRGAASPSPRRAPAQPRRWPSRKACRCMAALGMTDQFEHRLLHERARVCQELFGDSNYHADQLAAAEELLSGCSSW